MWRIGAATAGARQAGGGDLVEQRLEQVVIGAIDHRHAHRRARQRPRGEQAAEAAADDDDMMGPCVTECNGVRQIAADFH